jgi:hypothetical protein
MKKEFNENNLFEVEFLVYRNTYYYEIINKSPLYK